MWKSLRTYIAINIFNVVYIHPFYKFHVTTRVPKLKHIHARFAGTQAFITSFDPLNTPVVPVERMYLVAKLSKRPILCVQKGES